MVVKDEVEDAIAAWLLSVEGGVRQMEEAGEVLSDREGEGGVESGGDGYESLLDDDEVAGIVGRVVMGGGVALDVLGAAVATTAGTYFVASLAGTAVGEGGNKPATFPLPLAPNSFFNLLSNLSSSLCSTFNTHSR